LGDADELSSRLAGEVLAGVGTEALEPLIARLREGNVRERIGAARALADMRRPEAIEALFSALQDESTLVRHWAEVGLERLGQDFVFFLP
jgi:HEAT repeat protein